MRCPKCQAENPETVKFCGECGTQLGGHETQEDVRPGATETLRAPLKELTRGTLFAGRFEVIEELGKGGMGKVYRVFDKKVEEEVALKLVKPEVAADREVIDRFRSELKMSRKISHRNVSRMYDLGEEEGTYYITMEYVPGEDLKSFIHRARQLNPETAVAIAEQVAEGLTEAHRLGIVHRDLKPSNIMIDKEGNAKIMDFGIARSLREKGITGEGMIIGTPEYMSPEQVEAKDVDQRSDIYSLGVILYEMATSHVPFEGETALSIAMKHKGEIPKNPRLLNPSIPDDLSGVILKCLEKDREKRYQSAADLRAELEKIEKGIPTTDRVVPGRKPITSRPITVQFSLKKLFVPALIFIVLVAAGIIIWRGLSARKAAPLPSLSGVPTLAVLYFENKSGDAQLDNWRDGLAELLIASLSQSKYIRVVSGEEMYTILKRLGLADAKKYSSEDIEKIAGQTRATHVLRGSFITAGESFVITAGLQGVGKGEAPTTLRLEARSENEIIPKVDELTRQIKEGLNLTAAQLAGDIEKEAANITTSSPEAFKYYVESRKYHYRYEFGKSAALLEKTIAIDPEFAMAYRALGAAYQNLGDIDKAKKNRKKALDLSDRLSDKERLLIEGDFHYYLATEKDWPKAVAALNKLLQLYPGDSLANHTLGNLYLDIEEWERAIEHYEVCRKNRYSYLALYESLAAAYQAKGLYDKAEEVLRYCLENISDSPVPHLLLAHNYYAQARLDQALAEVDKANVSDPIYRWTPYFAGRIFMIQGDLAKARREFTKSLEEQDAEVIYQCYQGLFAVDLLEGKYEQAIAELGEGIEKMNQRAAKSYAARFHLLLAYVDSNAGRSQKALEECQEGMKLALELEDDELQRLAVFSRARSYLRAGSLAEAQKTAEELRQMIESGINKKKIRYYTHLAGMIELERKNYPQAIEYFRSALESLPYGPLEKDASYIDSLASAYYQSGNLAKARETYEKITPLVLGRFISVDIYGDLFARSFYMLGKIAEQEGDKARADKNYRRFLDLWKDADPGRIEVEDAKKRLSALGT